MYRFVCFIAVVLLAIAPAVTAFGADADAGKAIEVGQERQEAKDTQAKLENIQKASEAPKVAAENSTQSDDDIGTDAPTLDYDSD